MSLTKEQILSIKKMRDEGKKNKEIADILKTTETTVIRWIKRLRDSGHDIKKRVGRTRMELSINK